MSNENIENKKDIKQNNNKKSKTVWLILLFCIVLVSFLFTFAVSYIKKLNYNKKIQNYITFISENKLNYVGQLSLQRSSYNAIEIDKNLLLISGKGDGDISKKGEIFDLNKKKTSKIIQFKKEHFNDFMYKFGDFVFILGSEIELLDLKTLKSQIIQLPDDNYNFNGGFATRINENEILLICGNVSLPINFIDENIRTYIYNTKNNEIKKIEDFYITKGLFNGFIYIKKPLITVENKTYLFACDYNKINSTLNKKVIRHSIEPTNCGIYTFNKDIYSFELIHSFQEHSFPFYVEQLNNEELLILTQRYTFSFNTNTKSVYKFSNNVVYPHIFARFISKTPRNEIIALGTEYEKSPYGRSSYLIDMQSRSIYDFNLVNFNKTTLIDSYGCGTAIYTENNNLVFIGLFDKNYVYIYK